MVAGINYMEDPANIFRKGPYEMGIVDNLMKGSNVTNVTNYDERLLQKYLIEKMETCPGTIVLGSSRVMQLGGELLGEDSIINNGVSGASLEDILAIWDLYKTKGCRVKKVFIGLDPYFLNENNDQSRWRVLTAEYNNCLKELGLERYSEKPPLAGSSYAKYKELWSLSYFKTSLAYLMRGVDVHYRPTTSKINKDFTKMTDGSIYYGEDSRNSPLTVINGYAQQSINETPMYSMREYKGFSKKYETILITFIEYLRKQGVQVEFFISPYHPMVYDFCKKNKYYNIVFDAEEWFKRVANEHNIKLTGTYNPYYYNFRDSSFYDGFHCKEDALGTVLKERGKAK
jgi:hypothetical protein